MTSEIKDEKVKSKKVKSKSSNTDRRINDLNKTVYTLRSKLARMETTVKHILEKQSAEIRVLERDGKWGGYTGVFYTNKKDNKQIVIDKAMNHYKTYFENKSFYEDKTLGLFVTNYKGKKLIKVLQDEKNKLKLKEIK